MRALFLFIVIVVFNLNALVQAQGVIISDNESDEPNSSAILEVKSGDKGLLIPRLNTVQRNEIMNPPVGLQIFNTESNCIEYYNGANWTRILPANTGSEIISEDNTAQPHPSAKLEIESQAKGFLPPRLTSFERDAIENPAIGLMIFNTTRKCIEFYTGAQWTSSDAAGTVKPFAGKVENIPDGWLLCNGESLEIEDYNDLFIAIGNQWGGIYPNFKLPDLRGVFLRGVNHERNDTLADLDAELRVVNGVGNTNEVGSYQHDAIRNIEGTFRADHTDITETTGVFSREGGNGKRAWDNWLPYNTVRFNASKVVPTGSDNRPKNAYVNYIIKY